MQKLLKRIIPCFLLLFLWNYNGSAQVTVGVSNYKTCMRSTLTIPVWVSNLVNVDSLHFTLSYSPSIFNYQSFSGQHSALNGGNFTVKAANGQIAIDWYRSTPCNIINDTLVRLTFSALSTGSAALSWNNTGFCFAPAQTPLTLTQTDGLVTVSPALSVVLTQIDPTCTNICNANYMAQTWGGLNPYQYLWNNKPGRFDSIQSGLCSGANKLHITDKQGCTLDTIFNIKGLPGPDVEITFDNDSIIYLQNPTLTFGIKENSQTHLLEAPLWDFGDGEKAISYNPSHTFTHANENTQGYYTITLSVKNDNGCEAVIKRRLAVKEAKLIIPNVMTPNNDGANDIFGIANYEKQQKGSQGNDMLVKNEFIRMEVYVFDRWGRKVFDATHYQNDWDAKGLSDGVYYYVLKTVGYYKTDKYKGSLTILGSGNSN